MADFAAQADLRGFAIDLSVNWLLPGPSVRSLRIVRQRYGYPVRVDDGLVVLDLADLFSGATTAWARIERTRFLLLNPRAEAGILQAERSDYFANPADVKPAQSTIRIYDSNADAMSTSLLTQGTLVIGSSSVTWTVTGGATLSVPFERQEIQVTSASLSEQDPSGAVFRIGFSTTLGGQLLRTVSYTEQRDPDSGDVTGAVELTDREPPRRSAGSLGPGLEPGMNYYYTAFGIPGERPLTATSFATGRHGYAEKLYSLLPAVHRYYDDPQSSLAPGTSQAGSFQLRRFLEVLGAGLDQAHSLGHGLRTVQDLEQTRADYLPALSRWIGWELDRTLSTRRQRTDVLFAPEVFATVGTLPNIQQLVHRSTGWGCQAKEFHNNVFLTNAADPIKLWELWQLADVPAALTTPALPTQVTRAVNDSIDARPAIVTEPGSQTTWLLWHARRPPSGRRQLWLKTVDGSDPPRPLLPAPPSDGPPATFSDEWPTAIADGPLLRIFWGSDRVGSPGIWTTTMQNGVVGTPMRLTNHPAGDFHPSAVKDASGKLWVFFESSRRGPTDIWAITLAPGSSTWSAPQRITSGAPRDEMPVAVVNVAGSLRMFYTAYRGDRSRIFKTVFDGQSWSAPVDNSTGDPAPVGSPRFRDEAPSAVVFGGTVWLFFSSNRDGRWRIYSTHNTGVAWTTPVALTAPPSAELEPAAFVDAKGALRVLFRTQRGGEKFRSRTVDFSDLGAIQTGQVEDRWHYTYAVDRGDTALYARDTVGLYITPDDNINRGAYQAEADRVRSLVEPLRPLPVQFVWFVEPPKAIESLYGQVDIGERYVDDFPAVERVGDVGDSSSVTLPDYSLLHTVTPGSTAPLEVTASSADLTTLRRRTFFPAPR